MTEIQAVYEKMSPRREQGTGQGIVISWGLTQNQGDFSHEYPPGILTITVGDREKGSVAGFLGQMMRPYGEVQGKGRLESSWGADFPQKGGENLETEQFFSFSGAEKVYDGLGALYEDGMIGKDEPGEIREEYGFFSQFAGTAIEWAEISGIWIAEEPKTGDNQEVIRYFEFSEPIGGGGGGGGGGGALLAPYKKMEGGAYRSDVEPVLFGYVQSRGSHWGNSLNYGGDSASMAVSPSRNLGNGKLSGSWGGFTTGLIK